MRVLLVVDGMHPRDGGPPAVVAGSAAALRARGIEVAVLTAVRPGDESEVRSSWNAMLASGVSLHFAPRSSVISFLLRLPPEPLVRQLVEQADVVHVHGLWHPLLIGAARFARKIERPYFFSVHGVLDHRAMRRTMPKWLKKRLTVALAGIRELLDDASAVIFGSEAEARESWIPSPAMRCAFIPNGVDVDTRRMLVPAEARARVKAIAPQFKRWSPSLLYFSRIHPEKGPDMLVEAFTAVAADFPDAGLLMAGLRQDDGLLAELQRGIGSSGYADRIALTTELTGSSSRFVHSLCDIFVLPSHAEGFSVAMIEALAHGMPCLITKFCHAPMVESEGAGVVVDPTPKGIEQGLRHLLSLTPEQRTAMGGRARSLFEAQYTWDRVAERLEGAYRAARTNSPRCSSYA